MKKIYILLFLLGSFGIKAHELIVANPYSAQFKKAYALYPSIPKGLLESVAFTQSRFTHLDSQEQSCIGLPKAYGVMGLIADGKNYFRNNLTKISQLSGFSESEIKNNPETNIIAYAAAFNALQQQNNLFNKSIGDYQSIFTELSELPVSNDLINNFALNSHLYQIYWFLNNGEFQDAYSFPDYHLNLKTIFGSNYEILSSSSVKLSKTNISNNEGQNYKLNNILSPDYPPALWTPAPSCNYNGRGGTAITAVTIHDVEGSYAGCISWFQNCASSVSAHYVVRSSDGQITQMVLEINRAWHVGSENSYCVGIEHEGYNNTPIWYTLPMYTASAALVKDICVDNGINPLRTYYGPGCSGGYTSCLQGSCVKVKGHQMFPNQTHTDPGPYWNWDKYYKLINNTYSLITYTAVTGNFYDSGGAGGNYTDDERKVYLFTSPGATNITLNFTAFSTESGYDYLFIRNGGNINSPLIGKYSGTVSPGTITSTNDSLLVEFRSDCGIVSSGWAANYTINGIVAASLDIISSVQNNSLVVFPNPFTNQINISFNLENSGDVNISLLDVLGREILNTKSKENPGTIIKTISAPQLANGVYWIKLDTGKNILYKKLLKE